MNESQAIKYWSKLSFAKLRKMQEINEQQIQIVVKKEKTGQWTHKDALWRLQQMSLILAAAINIKLK